MTYYDAEIEYLEGTGVQYIDTEIIPTLLYSFECGFYYVSYDNVTDASATLFGCQSTWITESFTLLVTPSKKGLYNCWGNKYTRIEKSNNTTYWNTLIGVWHTLEFKNKETYIDGIKKLSAVSNTSGEPTLSIHLFNSLRNGNPTFGKGSIKRISYAKIFNENGILLIDLIPVRIGSVGYMYDKVSDRLFGNAGTGSFTLGPDVKVNPGIIGTHKVSLLRRKLLQFMPKYKPNYLCFTAIDKGTFTLTIPAALTTSNLSYVEYSVDDCNTWVKTDNVTNTAITITTPEIRAGKKVYWRGSGLRTSNSNSGSNTYCAIFSSTCKYNASGALLSLLKGREIVNSTTVSNNYTFSRLFYGDTHLVSAENLIFPTNTATYYCDWLFYRCTSLVTAPKILPATTLSAYCYRNMFCGCSNLLIGPELPALTLVGQCYQNMFNGCTKLNYIKMLATNVSATLCLNAWMYNVQTNSGTFIRNPEATWIVVGQHGIQTNWTWFDGTESENDETITFVDPEVQRIMVAQWGGKMGGAAAGSTRKCGIGTSTTTGVKRGGYADGVIYKKQVETIVTINSQFYQNKVIVDFSDLNKLTSLTTIQSSASGNNANRGFRQCTNLKYITFPNSLKTLGSGYTYGRGMFQGTALEEVYIPDSVTSMGENTFGDCSKLVSVRWSSNVPIPVYTGSNWAAGTFQNCSNLETLINAPLTITTIRSYEFQRCSKLDFSFLDFTKLTFIGSYGFAYNTGIPTNLMLLSCTQVDNYFLRDAGTHAVYMPSITANLALYHFGYAKLSILDLGENSTGYIGWAGLTGSPKIVLRANSVYKTDGTTARYTMYNTGAIGKIYVYSDILDDFKALYTGVASKTYAIGGAEWIADFGSSDEWADYPNGVNPLIEENE